MKRAVKDIRFIVCGTILVFLVLLSIFSPLLPLKNPNIMDIANRLKSPNLVHLLGTDEFGRDILSRLLVGIRVSLVIGFSSSTLAALAGIFFGISSAFTRAGSIFAMRFVDFLLIIPPIILAAIVIGFFGRNLFVLILVIAALYSPIFARLAYGTTKSVKEESFIEAAYAIGASKLHIIQKAILPNILSPLLVQFSFSISKAILLESGLSFLGLGVSPPTPSLGQAIASGRQYMYQNPLYVLWPALLLSSIILCLNLFGDALRDYLDPRTRYRPNKKGGL